MFKIKKQQLESGIKVVFVPMPALKSVTTLLLVNTGSRYEEPTEYGLAHLLEHLVFRGTHKYPDSLTLSIALDSIGASSNAFTAKEYTGFYVTAASSHLEFCLEMLRELVFFPLIRDEDVEQEKAVVIEEIKMHRDSPEDFIADEFEQAVYQGSSLEHPISGSIESVSVQTSKSLQAFLNKWYGLENLTLVIAGDKDALTKKNLLKNIDNIFSDKNSFEDRLCGKIDLRANHHLERRQGFFAENCFSTKKTVKRKRDTEQAHLVMGWPALKRDDSQRYVLTVLATVMGGNRSSRLFQTIREQANLAYYIYADVDQYQDAGLLGVSAGLNSKKVEQGIDLIKNEFGQLITGKKPIIQEELNRAQAYLTGRVTLSLESSRAVAQHYGLSWLLLNRIEEPQDVIGGIKSVTLDQLHSLATKIISADELRVAVVSSGK